MPEGSILDRLDRIMAELAELRAQVAARDALDEPGEAVGEDLIEISTAVARFNRPPDTLRYWCRTEGCGQKIGGRWMASPRAIRKKLGMET